MPSSFQIESVGKSDIGLVRTHNEDVFRELTKERFFVLADGMGGHNAGEIAAARAVEYMCSAVQNFFVKPVESIELDQVTSHIGALIENTNLWVHHLGSSDPKLHGMGTTLCSILFHQNFIIYSHVGDSRIYRMRQKKLEQLTSDHIIDTSKNRKSPLSETQKAVSSSKKVLAQAIGTSIMVRPEVDKQAIESGDVYMMCSDGLSDLVHHEEIEDVLAHESDLIKAASTLIEKAKAKGGRDNITLVLVRVK